MAIKTKEEILKQLNDKFGEDTSDDVLSLLEDISDTFTDLSSKASDTTDWKQKYEECDRDWRTKYKERFMSPADDSKGNPEEPDDEPEDDSEMTSFDELFKNE